ncbi:MAG: hypothetical protein KZQ83_01795 [gamma proteobacterium symbiont of Taylorina sp.]|nr:hypothetical protein [gamma proteobacterium symbiont of Taylorina sp.]
MSNEANNESSDSNFYLTMLAVVVGMGFYVSYDVEQRYGSSNASTTEVQPVVIPVLVETAPAEVAPALIETTIVEATIVEIKSVAVDSEPAVEEAKLAESQPVEEAVVPVKEVKVKQAEVAKPATPVAEVETTAKSMNEAAATEVADVIKTITKYVPVPVPVPVAVPTTQRVIIKTEPPVESDYQSYYPPYGQSYQGGNYYQPQNPYNSPYGNYQQQQPYGGYNPYQQR